MSNNLRRYPSIPNSMDYGGDELSLTATMQGKYGSAIQFTIGGKFAVIAPNQLRDICDTIEKRIVCEKGYSATDWCKERIVKPKQEKHP
jgi:hypothetical protein